jgi:fermentation-respiration switch protein FrsA (DUF1100 family)
LDPTPLAKQLLQFAMLLAIGYGALLIYVWFFQSRLLYFPHAAGADSGARPTDIGLDYEVVHFETEDGVRLHGWFVPAEAPRGVLLFMHGNAGNITHRLESIDRFHRLGLSVLIFDYRGYGASEGRPSENGTYLDAQAAWRHLVDDREVAPGRIVLFGRSLGAAVAAWLAARTRPAALIVESGFTSVPDLAARHYWYLPVRTLSRFDYDTRAHVRRIACPLLVVHSADDEIAPFAHGEAIFAAGPEPKSFLRLSGGHNDAFVVSDAAYTAGLRNFLDGHLPGVGGASGSPP